MRHGGGVERFGIGAISKLNPRSKRSVNSKHSLEVEGEMEESGVGGVSSDHTISNVT